jgi:hypothetical protein
VAVRNDISINFNVSPRVITVANDCCCASPSLNLLIQDLHDTVRTIEAEPSSMSFPRIIDSAGKESVGNCLFVGITSTLQDAVVEFTDRLGPCFVQARISGGNLVALDACCTVISPIQVSDYTQVTYSQAVSAVQIAGSSEWTSAEKACLLADITSLVSIATGRWRILNNQMLFFDCDNTTVLYRFDLFDAAGNPTDRSPFERFPTCP